VRIRWRDAFLAAMVAMTLFGACGGGNADKVEADRATTTAPPKVEGTVTVYAAQSLANAFTDVGKAFESEHPGVSVAFNFAGSATLVTQISQGAPADVFASADQPNMDRLSSSGLIDGKSRIFAKNLLHIVVAEGNPKNIATLADLARSNVATVLCAANVPCGNYAREALEKAGVQVTPKSDESSVAGVIGRVQNGEADAGIVYVTDVLANNDKVSGVDIPPEYNVVAEYPHAALKNAPNPVGAQAFMAYVESTAGQGLLAKYGFLPL
jgi:molybdate transport system substrate-binding protein